MASVPHDLPYYVLVSHTPGGAAPSSTSFSHPIIEYHYADDSPHSLLPGEPGEHVIVLDYTSSTDAPPSVKSLSSDLAIAGLKITEAPGAATTPEDGNMKNTKMFVIDTIGLPEEVVDDSDWQFESAHAVLTRFKQRNAVLHRALDYGQPAVQSGNDDVPTTNSTTPIPEG